MKNIPLFLLLSLLPLAPLQLNAMIEGAEESDERALSSNEAIQKKSKEQQTEALIEERENAKNGGGSTTQVLEETTSINISELSSSKNLHQFEEDLTDLATLEQRLQEAQELTVYLQSKGPALSEAEVEQLFQQWSERQERSQEALEEFQTANNNAGTLKQQQNEILSEKLNELIAASEAILKALGETLENLFPHNVTRPFRTTGSISESNWQDVDPLVLEHARQALQEQHADRASTSKNQNGNPIELSIEKPFLKPPANTKEYTVASVKRTGILYQLGKDGWVTTVDKKNKNALWEPTDRFTDDPSNKAIWKEAGDPTPSDIERVRLVTEAVINHYNHSGEINKKKKGYEKELKDLQGDFPRHKRKLRDLIFLCEQALSYHQKSIAYLTKHQPQFVNRQSRSATDLAAWEQLENHPNQIELLIKYVEQGRNLEDLLCKNRATIKEMLGLKTPEFLKAAVRSAYSAVLEARKEVPNKELIKNYRESEQVYKQAIERLKSNPRDSNARYDALAASALFEGLQEFQRVDPNEQIYKNFFNAYELIKEGIKESEDGNTTVGSCIINQGIALDGASYVIIEERRRRSFQSLPGQGLHPTTSQECFLNIMKMIQHFYEIAGLYEQKASEWRNREDIDKELLDKSTSALLIALNNAVTNEGLIFEDSRSLDAATFYLQAAADLDEQNRDLYEKAGDALSRSVKADQSGDDEAESDHKEAFRALEEVIDAFSRRGLGKNQVRSLKEVKERHQWQLRRLEAKKSRNCIIM